MLQHNDVIKMICILWNKSFDKVV